MFESHVVNEFLVERFGAERAAGAALMPPAALDRARVRLWNEHLDSQLAPAHFTLLMNKNATDEPAKRAALDAALQHYEDHLVGPYLCGDAFTLADVAALPFFERLTFSLRHFKQYDAIDARRFPRTAAWLERAFARPSFVTTKRPEESLVPLDTRWQAGWMQGAAGIASFLLHLNAVNGGLRSGARVPWPDEPWAHFAGPLD